MLERTADGAFLRILKLFVYDRVRFTTLENTRVDDNDGLIAVGESRVANARFRERRNARETRLAAFSPRKQTVKKRVRTKGRGQKEIPSISLTRRVSISLPGRARAGRAQLTRRSFLQVNRRSLPSLCVIW